jgi:hypothetical protein
VLLDGSELDASDGRFVAPNAGERFTADFDV